VYRARKYIMYPFVNSPVAQSVLVKPASLERPLTGIVNMRAVNVMSNLNPSLPFIKPRIRAN